MSEEELIETIKGLYGTIKHHKDIGIALIHQNAVLQKRIDKAKELCKIVLDNEDKNKDLLGRISVIYRELQSKE